MPDITQDDLTAALRQFPSPKGIAAMGAQADPDKSAEAYNLGQTTGVSPQIISNDLDGFKNRIKLQAAGDIVAQSPQLSNYVASSPMKAKVSGDDWGNLSNVSDKLAAVPQESLFGAMARGYKQATEIDPWSGETKALADKFDNPLWKYLVYNEIAPDVYNLRELGTIPGGFINAAGAGLGNIISRMTGDPGQAEATEREVTDLANSVLPMLGLGRGPMMISKLLPYLAVGKDIPIGLDPAIDTFKKAESTAHVDALKEAFQEAQSSTTKQRVPEFFRDFVAQHTGERTIGISSGTVKALYGDKVPAAGDGLLGFVPDIATQYSVAMETGADVQVPIADMLTHMTPEVFQQIEDGIRPTPDGFTKMERPPKPGVEEQSPVEGVIPAINTEPKLFKAAAAIGMSEKQLIRYERLIGEQQEEVNAANLRRAAAEEEARQSPEWKANRIPMREQVEGEITQQPRFVADLAIRNGDLPKLSADALTDAQKEKLPRMYWSKDGMLPDRIASMVGYDTGDELVDDLWRLHANRQGVKPGDYLNNLIDSETDRRMEAKYGKFDENVLASAKELALSKTQLDLLHAELEGMAGGKLPYSKEELRGRAAEAVGQAKLGNVNSDHFMAAAFRASKTVEEALLSGDPTAAFQQRQAQWMALTYAKEATAVEKLKGQFDKITKTFSKREVPGALQEYTNQIHSLMVRLGLGVKRSVQDIEENIVKDNYKDFDEFVNAKESSFRELHVPDFLREASWKKNLESLTVDEFRQVAGAFKALAFNARDELKVIRAGDKADLHETINEMVEKLQSLGEPKKYRIDKKPNAVAEGVRSFGWSGIQMESMFNRFDRDDPKGVFNQTLVRTYTEAANFRDRLVKEFQGKLNALGEADDLNKVIKNDLFVDPITKMPFDMSRRNVLGILQFVGNDSNMKKLGGGYNLKPEQIMEWLGKNTTKEDWDRAQAIGKIFNQLFDMADNMSHQVSGVGIQKLALKPIEGPFGTYDGWYHPVSYDPIRPGQSKSLIGPNALEQEGYYRATTPQGYTKGRTGYIAPVQLNLDIVGKRMQQMIHDITMRPAIIQLSKFFYNPDFKRAVINYYGQHQAEMMIPFLRDTANVANFSSQSERIMHGWLNAFSQNMVSAFIGMNPSTVMKHGPTALVNSLSQVGLIPWAREAMNLLRTDGNGDTNWRMAVEKSDELNRRMRNWQEVIANTGQELNLRGTKTMFGDIRSVAQYAGSFPVAASDMFSAVPTWLAEYKKEIALGEDEGQARFLADRAVRQAHGSSIITNKPAIARSSNAIAGTFSRLYGFFSHILQKQYEIGWRVKDAYGLAREGNIEDAAKAVPKIAGMVVSYVIMPALIEEMVSPYTNSERDSWGDKAAKTLALGMSSSMIGVRDLGWAIINGRDPVTGILSEGLKSFSDVFRDMHSQKMMTPLAAGKFLRHMTIAAGYATGLTNAQEGKSLQFVWNYFHNQDHPQGPWQWATGLRFGTTKGHSRSFQDYLRQELGK